MPVAYPYNAPQYAITPTPDGTGSAVHPSVLDFGPAKWNNWRYWMAMTPYYQSNISKENPSVLVSNDGFTWKVPAGVINPIIAAPPSPRYNSDVDIEFDPGSGRLYMLFRQILEDNTQQTFTISSLDGVAWTAPAALQWVRDQQHISPSLVRRGVDDWWLFTVRASTTPSDANEYHRLVYHRATSPTGVWDGPFDIGVPYPGGEKIFHVDVLWDESRFVFLFANRSGKLSSATWDEDVLIAKPVFMSQTQSWDTALYRGTFTPLGDKYQVWYSASGTSSWRIGYTQIPKSLLS